MTRQLVRDLNTPIGKLLKAASVGGVVIESKGRTGFALMPLDDNLIDYLLENSPQFADHCNRIRSEMKAGRKISLEELEQRFEPKGRAGKAATARKRKLV